MKPGGHMYIVHLLYPLYCLRVLLHCLEEVGESLACGSGEHGYHLSRIPSGGNSLDKDQHHTVLDPFPEEIRLDKRRGAKGGAEDVDAVVVRPLAVADMIRVVR